jgi:hypothetical protein
MNNHTLGDKDYVSVLPRIIDPKMQFTKESIENTFDKKNTDVVCKIDDKLNNNPVIKNKIENVPSTSTSFFNEYKYVIFIIVIVIITIVIIYFIYNVILSPFSNIKPNSCFGSCVIINC